MNVSGWLDRLQDFFGKELHQQHKLFGREKGEAKLSSWVFLSLIWCVYVSVFNSSNREGKCVCAFAQRERSSHFLEEDELGELVAQRGKLSMIERGHPMDG